MDGLETPNDSDYIELDQLQVRPSKVCMLPKPQALLCKPACLAQALAASAALIAGHPVFPRCPACCVSPRSSHSIV